MKLIKLAIGVLAVVFAALMVPATANAAPPMPPKPPAPHAAKPPMPPKHPMPKAPMPKPMPKPAPKPVITKTAPASQAAPTGATPASTKQSVPTTTGGTIVKAADTLFENGAAEVIVAATHGILSEPAAQRLQESRISEVVVTNTLPIPEDRQFEKLTILSIAPLLAQAIYEVFTDGSVPRMFETPERIPATP